MCSFIFKYVPVMNHGHLLADKNSLACNLTIYLWISGCRSCLEPSSCQKCPWLSACFLNPHFCKPGLIRGQISQSCCVFRLETDYKQANKLHNIYILNTNTHQVDIISLNLYFKIFGNFYNGEKRCRVLKQKKLIRSFFQNSRQFYLFMMMLFIVSRLSQDGRHP